MTTVTLAPVDLAQCQVVSKVRLGARDGAFMLGVRAPKWERCEGAAEYVAVQRERDDDGLRGAMSLCAECLSKLQERDMEVDVVTVDGWREVAPVLAAHGLYDGPLPTEETP